MFKDNKISSQLSGKISQKPNVTAFMSPKKKISDVRNNFEYDAQLKSDAQKLNKYHIDVRSLDGKAQNPPQLNTELNEIPKEAGNTGSSGEDSISAEVTQEKQSLSPEKKCQQINENEPSIDRA